MRFAVTAVLLIALGGAVAADVVHLTDGKTVEGLTEDLGEYVKITTVSGSAITLPKSIIARIEVREDPRKTLRERLGQLKRDDAEGRFKLALWCREHDLTEEYGLLLEKTLEINPRHAEAKKLLYEYNKFERALPVNGQASAKLLAEFGSGFKIYHTPHYRICYNCEDSFLMRRAALFERAYERFYRYFEEKGYVLDVISDHLEAVLFDSREDFVAYIEVGQKSMPPPPGGYIPPVFERSAGFYSYATNRIYFYNAINDAEYRALRKKIYSIPYGRLTKEGKKMLTEYKRQLSLKEKVDQNVSVTIHEATHQLTFNLGLLDARAGNPLWVVEGLAMYFETATDGFWYGAGRLNRDRLAVYQKISQRPPLKTLLVNDYLFSTGSQQAIAINYATAWALTYYLLEEHPEQFVHYLLLLRAKRPGVPISPAERLRDFASVFGNDLDLFLGHWYAFMDKLK